MLRDVSCCLVSRHFDGGVCAWYESSGPFMMPQPCLRVAGLADIGCPTSSLAYPLCAEQIHSQQTTQGWLERIMEMARELKSEA
jgi:hypothetical protein